MQRWVQYALVSMLFAGATSVIAKLGLAGISAELGLAVRTAVVFVLIIAIAAALVPGNEWRTLTVTNLWWLGLSGLTTALSWWFYYRAIKQGEVSTVALIDKGSVVVALLLAWMILKESLTLQKLVGATLMLIGLLIVARAPNR